MALAAGGYAAARVKRDFWDFEVYRQAGVRALAAEPLYRAADGHFQFKYWPAFAFAMIPFGVIHAEVGKVLWYALTIGLIAVFIRRSIELLPGRRSTTLFLTSWALLLTGKFLVKELVNGQTNVLLGVLVMLSLVAARRGHRARAGGLIALAAFVKPYALLLLPWIAVVQGAVAVGTAVAVLAAGLLLPALAYGWHGNLALLADWYRAVVDTTPANLLIAENISFATMWAKWLGPSGMASLLAALTTAACLAAAVWLWLTRHRVTEPAYLEVSYLLLLMPLISPQGWDYVLLLATPAIICLVDRYRSRPLTWRFTVTAGLLLTSATIYDLLGRTLYLSLMSVSAVTVGALLIAVSVVRLRLAAEA